MKKVFSFFTLCVVLCVASCYDDTALRERLEALETTTIASINEQISGIKKSITDLEAIDKELDAAIKALINEDGALDERIKSLNDSITELRKADAATQAEIDDMAIELQNLVTKDKALDEEISALEKSIAELKATDASMTDEINAMQETLIVLKSQDDAINKQIAEIEKAIEELRSEDSALQGEIASINERLKKLEERDATFLADIDSLKAKDEALDARISELKSYVETELSSNKDWVSATFSTLEQYEALCKEIAAIKLLISEQEESLMEALTEAIAKSETTMKTWVNEQLTGYWTIAQTQAKLDTIKSTTDKEITSIRKEIQTVKDELTTAYKTEIQKAIEESNGNLSAQIAEINSNLSTRITAIEARLTVIEEKLNNLTREFAIKFNDNEIGIMPGGTTTVRYTITGATQKTIVRVFAQNGWTAKVTPISNNEGTITVTAPTPMSNDEIIVLVYDGEHRTIMSTLNFAKSFVTPSRKVIKFGTSADTISVPITSNIDFEVSIPVEAQNWLSVVNPTRSITTKTISFACTNYTGDIRRTTVNIVDKNGLVFSTISFVQHGGSDFVDTELPAETSYIRIGTAQKQVVPGRWYFLHNPRNPNDRAEAFDQNGYIQRAGGFVTDKGNGAQPLLTATSVIDELTSEEGVNAANYYANMVAFHPVEGKESVYKIEFGTGNWLGAGSQPVSVDEFAHAAGNSAEFNFYPILNDTDGQPNTAGRFGWNKFDMANRIDNNGAGGTVVFWSEGESVGSDLGGDDDAIKGNRVWQIYDIEIVMW